LAVGCDEVEPVETSALVRIVTSGHHAVDGECGHGERALFTSCVDDARGSLLVIERMNPDAENVETGWGEHGFTRILYADIFDRCNYVAAEEIPSLHLDRLSNACVDAWLTFGCSGMHPLKMVPLIAVLLVVGLKQSQVLTAAESKDSVALVPTNERSAHFAAVNRQLELGGKFYGYVDVDGDVLKLAASLRQVADSIAKAEPAAAPFLKPDFAKIFDDLGLSDIKAAGLSSVQEAGGSFRNRVFFYTPGGRHGLLAGLGGSAAPYIYTKLAPADADFYSEAEIDLPAVYSAIRAVVSRVGGETVANLMDTQLKAAGTQGGASAFDVIQSLKGRGVSVLRFDPEKNIALPTPQPFNIPAFSLLIRVDGLGGALEKALAAVPMFDVSQDGALKLFAFKGELPIEGLKPVIAIEGKALYLATSIAFLKECRNQKSGLDQNPAYQRALAQVGRDGNGVAYVSPRFFARVRQLDAINPNAAPEAKRVLGMVVAQLPEVNYPIIAERINLPDGILVKSQSYRSLKQDVAMLAVYNPVTVGFLAAMAIPAFQKVRSSSQEKTIQNNLRQFSAAAQQYMLENAKNVAKYDDIVGPDKAIRELSPVAGEDYKSLVVHTDDESISVHTADGKVISIRL